MESPDRTPQRFSLSKMSRSRSEPRKRLLKRGERSWLLIVLTINEIREGKILGLERKHYP